MKVSKIIKYQVSVLRLGHRYKINNLTVFPIIQRVDILQLGKYMLCEILKCYSELQI